MRTMIAILSLITTTAHADMTGYRPGDPCQVINCQTLMIPGETPGAVGGPTKVTPRQELEVRDRSGRLVYTVRVRSK